MNLSSHTTENLKIKKIILNAFLILTISLALTGCTFNNKKEHALNSAKQIELTNEQEQNAKIKTEMLQKRLIHLKITIPAQFKAVNKLLERIYAPLNGKITKVFVEPGDIVKVGQPIIEIKSDEIGQIQLQFLEEYINVTSEINQLKAMYNLSLQTYKREKTLFNEGISSRAEYEIARAQMLKDKANLDAQRMKQGTIIKVFAQRIALYGGNESTIRRAIATQRIYPFITLTSHKNGIVLDRKVNPGEIIEMNKELFNLADLSTIWLVGYAFEKDAPHLQVGQDIVGEFEKEHNKSVRGKLSYVASILDTEKKTLEVRADVNNKDCLIKPNMYAEMIVDIGTQNTLAVPNTALQAYGDYNLAYVKVAPHLYEERKVEIGQKNDKYTVVIKGLKEGEEVVSQGGFSLLGESIKQIEK